VGGLARRATRISEIRKQEHKVLLLEAGDAFGPYMPIERKKARLLVQAMGQLGYDAYNLGARELGFGQEFIKTQTQQWKIPLLCANLIRTKEGSLFAAPYTVKDLGGFRVAILGLISARFHPPRNRPEDEELVVQDPISRASQIVEHLRSESNLIVVLGHLTMEEAEQLAEKVPGIQAIILAWGMGVIDPPVKIGETLILSAGTRGTHLGELYLHLDQNNRVISYYSRLTPLGRNIPDDPTIRGLITSYGLESPPQD
jgi:5'-nucleotidase